MIGRLHPKGWLGVSDAAVSGSFTMRATASPYSFAAIRLASMSKKTSPQLSAPITPFSSTARTWSSREADFKGGLAIISNITEKALSRSDHVLPLRRTDFAVVGLQLVELAIVERSHLPRQRVGG